MDDNSQEETILGLRTEFRVLERRQEDFDREIERILKEEGRTKKAEDMIRKLEWEKIATRMRIDELSDEYDELLDNLGEA